MIPSLGSRWDKFSEISKHQVIFFNTVQMDMSFSLAGTTTNNLKGGEVTFIQRKEVWVDVISRKADIWFEKLSVVNKKFIIMK